jgi:uncharacterized membrane protein YdfJ with MMPL/SSD domain
MTDMDSIPLNEPQRRHFEVVLASFEDTLMRIEQLADRRTDDERLLTHVDHDTPAAYLATIAPIVADVRAQVAELARTLHLEARRPSTARMIRALLISQIVHLQDSGSRRLRAYGSVDPAVSEHLDPRLDTMIDALETMRRHLEQMLRDAHAPSRA